MKTVRILALAIVAVGGCLTLRAAYMHAKAALAEVLIREAWADRQATGEARPPWPWADTFPVARMRIPRIGYDEIVLEGATPRTLAFGPAHMLSGAGFGEPGNLVLAGHRTSWFRPLQHVSRGDAIELEWMEAGRRLRRRRYVVEEIRIVDPKEVALLGPTSDDVLTLITCYPFGSSPYSPKRYIVRASPAVDAQVQPARYVEFRQTWVF